MRKVMSTMIALAITAGISGTAFAAEGSFTDVPKDHWSYAAIDQLVKDGILEGNGDGTYAGNRAMSRYEMAAIIARTEDHLKTANPADQALIEKLQQEYKGELSKLDDKYEKLNKRVDNVMLSGFVRTKYDHDETNHVGNNGNRHFYMNLEGKMRVGETWNAHFQSETNKNYTGNGNRGNNGDNGTVQRIWVEGTPAPKLNVTVGAKWWGYGFQNAGYGHAADGLQLDYDFLKGCKLTGFYLRPTQGDLVTMPNGQDTTIYGASVTGKVSPAVELMLLGAGNKNKQGAQMMSRMGEVDLRAKLARNLTTTLTYVRTNANDYKSTKAYRIDYKGTDYTKQGSFGMYARYVDYGRYGDMSHDDEWGSLPQDMKGWVLSVKYVPWANVEWETLYSDQTRNNSGLDTSMIQKAKRHLLRTQLDFHF